MEFGHLIAASQPLVLPGIAAFFAGSSLKRPMVRLFGEPDLKLAWMLRFSADTGEITQKIKVVSGNGNTYYGRLEGANFYGTHRADAEIRDRLSAFDRDPIGYVTKQGKLHGQCCMCNKPLTDDRSLAAGYGARCAKNWQLPWGKALTEVSTGDTI
jgi:hypothetical protein